MKRNFWTGYLTALLIVMALFAFAMPAYAGVWGSIKGAVAGATASAASWALENALMTIIGMIFMVIGTFWGGSKWGIRVMKAKAPVTEAAELIIELRNARKKSSPGGTDITAEEKDAVMKRAEDVLTAIAAAFGKEPAAATTS